ncbi:MAG: cytochrome c oxidase assembly protein, partial [Acidimicrobiales bacterium]
DPHIAAWSILVLAGLAIAVGHRRLGRRDGEETPWPRAQKAALAGGWVVAAVALTWPLADLAAHWSLIALVFQRVILTLAVPSLILLGMPYDVLRWLTRPAPVDAILDWCRGPIKAVLVFTVVMVGSMTIPVVEAQASSPVVRGIMDLVVLAAGFVLWLPVIGRVPGILRLKPVIRFVYLVVQAIVPAFLSFIYIFASHPLYPTFSHSHLAVGLRPLNDQQVSGFVSKLSLLLVLLTVAAVVLKRAQDIDEEDSTGEPLLWADVERELERVDRRNERVTRNGPEADPPPSSEDPGP